MPQHDHIYIGEVNLAHEHRPQHRERETAHTEEQPPFATWHSFLTGVIILPDRDATLQTVALLINPASPLIQRIDHLWFPLGEICYAVCGRAIPPLDEPPRF